MGGGTWSRTVYSNRTTAKLESHGTSFAYSMDTHALPTEEWKAEPALDPKSVNKAGEHEGIVDREALDSDEHPESLPIAVLFDVTGSMGRIPGVLQTKLPNLHGMLLRNGIEHPQILFGAIGDATCDRVPLQISQFESDNRFGEHLENIFLEGGGGGGNHESYELAAYYMARHTYLDSLEKRGKRGYLFFIGDERAYIQIDRRLVTQVIGDNLQENLSTVDIFAELQDKYDVFFLFAAQGNYTSASVVTCDADHLAIGWRELLGEQALVLEDADAVCETIAATIALREGVAFEDAMAGLAELGSDPLAIKAAGTALAAVGAGGGGGSVVPSDEFDASDTDSGVEAV